MQRIAVLLIALAVLGLVFGIVEARWPAIRGQKRLRAGVVTDVLYWLFTPTLGKLITGVTVFVSVLALAAILGIELSGDQLRGISERDTAIGRQPVVMQIIEFVLLADLLAYWQHRAFHTFGRLWRMHAVHHSSTQLDWLSSARVHPLNDALSSVAVATPLLLLGFAPVTIGAYMPFLTLYALMLHANVNWSLGPLGNFISSPAFHRWHHSCDAEALNKNFAGLFPFYDRLFGTLYFPRDRAASHFGVAGEAPPAGFLGQLAYPFKSGNTAESATQTA